MFLLNYGGQKQTVSVKTQLTDAVTTEAVQGEIALPAYGGRVLKWEA